MTLRSVDAMHRTEMHSAETRICHFPGCDRPPVPTTGGGQRNEYCEDPQHTPLKAYRARKKLQDKAARQAAKQPQPVTRPVTQAAGDMASLFHRVAEMRDELLATFEEIGTRAAVVTDPAMITAEIEAIKRDAEIQIAEAEAARLAAERRALAAEQTRDEALAERDEATAAAEEAIAELDAREQQLTEMTADRDRIVHESRNALHQLREETGAEIQAREHAEAERDKARLGETAALQKLDDLHVQHEAKLHALLSGQQITGEALNGDSPKDDGR